MKNIKKTINEELEEYKNNFNCLNKKHLNKIHSILKLLLTTIKNKKKILLIGNGGSAAQCQHLSAELVVKFTKERRAIPAVSLTTDTSSITACSNDFEFKFIFKRQIEAIGNRGDLLIAFSTSGKSKNILEGLKKAKQKFLKTILISSEKLKSNLSDVDILFKAPSKITSRIQETHLFIIHILCKLLDDKIK
jgi:D-sedoheptulose 7-phosphate isomerase